MQKHIIYAWFGAVYISEGMSLSYKKFHKQ